MQLRVLAEAMTDQATLPRRADRTLFGVVLMLGFCLTAPLLDVAAKLAAASVPVGQITTARFVVQCALMAPVVWIMGLSLRVPKDQWLALGFRALQSTGVASGEPPSASITQAPVRVGMRTFSPSKSAGERTSFSTVMIAWPAWT